MTRRPVLLSHGSGGKLTAELVASVFAPAFSSSAPLQMDDSAVLEVGGRIAFTTDCHVVKPLFFPGGDIGRLAVCGTVNDLAMVGAEPRYLTAGFILEEGLDIDQLECAVKSMAEAAAEAAVRVVAGDTKVVEAGKADGMFITTSGVGVVPPGVDISGRNARPGDIVIVSGTVGDHGIAVVSKREGLEFESTLESDVAPLNGLVRATLATGAAIRVLRDPTRGGLATTLNEIAAQSEVAIQVNEDAIPVKDSVLAVCEMLGFDPLYVANEGKLVAVVSPDDAERVLQAMRRTRYGEAAVAIGSVREGPAGRVTMRTRIGGTRFVQMLTGEMLPRIC